MFFLCGFQSGLNQSSRAWSCDLMFFLCGFQFLRRACAMAWVVIWCFSYVVFSVHIEDISKAVLWFDVFLMWFSVCRAHTWRMTGLWFDVFLMWFSVSPAANRRACGCDLMFFLCGFQYDYSRRFGRLVVIWCFSYVVFSKQVVYWDLRRVVIWCFSYVVFSQIAV